MKTNLGNELPNRRVHQVEPVRKNPARASRGRRRFSDDEEEDVAPPPPLPRLTSAPVRKRSAVAAQGQGALKHVAQGVQEVVEADVQQGDQVYSLRKIVTLKSDGES